jgi:hypothetical protein
MISSPREGSLMSNLRSPTLRELHAGDAPATLPRTRPKYAWLYEDPDLAPAARHETPLSAWA